MAQSLYLLVLKTILTILNQWQALITVGLKKQTM